MVEAGETGGFLDLVLAQIADFQAQEKELRSKVIAALIYPSTLVVVSLAVLVVLLTFFIPRFQTLFTGFGGQLPLITRMIVSVSDVVRSYGLFAVLGLALGGYFIRNWMRSQQGRRVWEHFLLRAPIVGKLIAQFDITHFCCMFGLLLAAGLPRMRGGSSSEVAQQLRARNRATPKVGRAANTSNASSAALATVLSTAFQAVAVLVCGRPIACASTTGK
jgi:type II secretory pathway component PulF